jgi:protein arginine N-methyltransferase 1
VVVDIGTGSGILAFFAAQAGARRVYAIEAMDTIYMARHLALQNSLLQKVVFLKGLSYTINLPEPADVVVGENLGHFGLEENILDIYEDARARFLKATGALMPRGLRLFLFPVELTAFEESEVDVWKPKRHDVDFSLFSRFARNQMYACQVPVETFLADPKPYAEFDLTKDSSKNLEREIEFIVKRAGVMNGLGGYFETQLSPRVSISTSPLQPHTHWQQVFFPMEAPKPVAAGDVVRAQFKAYCTKVVTVFFWRADILKKDGRKIVGEVQSNWPGYGVPGEVIPNMVAPLYPDHQRVLMAIISCCDGRSTIDSVAADLCARLPERFPDKQSTRSTISEAFSKPDQILNGAHSGVPSSPTNVHSEEDRLIMLSKNLSEADSIDKFLGEMAPSVNVDRRARAFIISWCNGRNSFIAIANAVAQRFSEACPSADAALSVVKSVVEEAFFDMFGLKKDRAAR